MAILKSIVMLIIPAVGILGICAIGSGIKIYSDMKKKSYVLEKEKDSAQMNIGLGIFLLILVILVGKGVGGIGVKSTPKSTNSREYKSSGESRCKSCGRFFSDDDNVRSIKHTNMCENCYNNYKFGTEAQDAASKYR